MRNIFIAALILFSTPSYAKYAGKLDLVGDPEAIAFRELNDGMWLIGGQKQLWHLQNLDSGAEVFHVSAFYATRLEGQNPAYGPSVGVNVGPLLSWAAERVDIFGALHRIEVIASASSATPPWVKKLGDWTSLDFYGGYRPSVAADQHHIVYGAGGKVRVPFSGLRFWGAGKIDPASPPAHGL